MSSILVIAVPILQTNQTPYGPAVVSGILRQAGHETSVWDMNIDLYHHFRNEWNEIVDVFALRAVRGQDSHSKIMRRVLRYMRKQIRSRLADPNLDAVLLSVFSSHSLDAMIPITAYIREYRPDLYVLAGGRGLDNIEKTTGLAYADYYARYLPVNCWYVGDAENNLVSVLTQRHQGVFKSPPVAGKDIESVPPADWTGYDFTRYEGYATDSIRMPITGSKGCVRQCTFCDVASSWPKFVFRKGSDIGRELIDTYQRTGIRKFEFTDNLVNGSITNFREMNNTVVSELPDTLDYIGYAICRPRNEFPKSDFELARRAGASMFKVGIESGSEKVRHDMKKKFSNDDINWFAENCYDQGIRQLWLMFVGYPSESEQDFQDSLRLLERHRHLSHDGMVTVFLSLPMMLLTGSGFMRRYGEEYGLMHNTDDPLSDFFWTSHKYQDNTFQIRVDRWRRFIDAIYKYGFDDQTTRQAEKFLEIEGVEKTYRELYKDGKRIIPINTLTPHINKETHV